MPTFEQVGRSFGSCSRGGIGRLVSIVMEVRGITCCWCPRTTYGDCTVCGSAGSVPGVSVGVVVPSRYELSDAGREVPS